MPKHNRALRPPDDCLSCPHSIDERVLGVDDGLACDAPGGPVKIMGDEGYDGLMFYAPPEECPLWASWRKREDRDEAMREDAGELRREARI